MARIDPSQYASLGLPSSGPASPQQAFQGQINTAVGGGQSALAGGNVAQNTQAADIASKNAAANVATQTQNPDIAATTAKSQQDVIAAKQQQVLTDAGTYFDQNKGKDQKVSPQDYNMQREKYVNAGGQAANFDGAYESQYTNPNNVFYNTENDIAVRKSLPSLIAAIHSYADADQAGETGAQVAQLEGLPVVGPYIKQGKFSKATAHDNLVNETKGNLLKLAGAGTGSTIKGSVTELGYAASLLPTSADSKDTANENISRLDDYLQKTYGTTLEDWGLAGG